MGKVARKTIRLVVCLLLVSVSLSSHQDQVGLYIWTDEDFEIAFADDHVHLVLPDTVPGAVPADATANTTYGVYTNSDRYKIVAGMRDFPDDPNIEVKMDADPPTGGVSVGVITWTNASVEGVAGEQDCVTGIVPATEVGIPVLFTLHCTGIPAPHMESSMFVNLHAILE